MRTPGGRLINYIYTLLKVILSSLKLGLTYCVADRYFRGLLPANAAFFSADELSISRNLSRQLVTDAAAMCFPGTYTVLFVSRGAQGSI